MNPVQFEGPVSGHNVFAGMHVSDGGAVNMTFAGSGPSSPIKPFSMIPFPPDPAFIKRSAISQWVEEMVAGVGRRAALVGLGGVGMLQLVYGWLTDEDNGPWLMIIDNADDSDILSQPAGFSGSERPLASYIPKTGRGSILVTSRSTRAAEMLVGEDLLFIVPVMEDSQAKDLPRKRVGEDLYEDDAADNLVVALDCLPLAIVQAASFIKRRSRRAETITTYLKKLQDSREKKSGLLAREATDLRRDDSASKAVVTTWQMTFNQVRRERMSAAELLIFMSFFHPQGIPDFVLNAFYDQDKDKDLEDDIEVLIRYSLVTTTAEEHTLEMHALVQFCTQIWLLTFDD
ncbi:hypothetical protein QQS21_007954 [Conoideocrella luteorostrata]|uniref:DUF7779 domain-containing protein n=1 Tax=Conoideocrella luteorostrata TaxID=1105319 RepID=A0AAJ0CJS4_9HYPO|nr:hypothetical protein QQS21_007954 [Conoideocrella luteorostrata]